MERSSRIPGQPVPPNMAGNWAITRLEVFPDTKVHSFEDKVYFQRSLKDEVPPKRYMSSFGVMAMAWFSRAPGTPISPYYGCEVIVMLF